MSYDLAPASSRSLPAAPSSLPPEPVLSPQLAPAVAGLVDRVVDRPARPYAEWTQSDRERALVLAPVDTAGVSDAVRQEARGAADRFHALLSPAGPDRIYQWLKAINAGVRNPQEDVDLKAVATAVSLLDLPAAAFTQEAQREGLRTWRFFPSVADVAALIEPVARRWQAKRAACLDIANGPRQDAKVAPAAWTRPTMQECAHASAQVAALKQSIAERDTLERRSALSVRARPLSPQQLIAGYEAKAKEFPALAPGLLSRAAALRKQHGLPARQEGA